MNKRTVQDALTIFKTSEIEKAVGTLGQVQPYHHYTSMVLVYYYALHITLSILSAYWPKRYAVSHSASHCALGGAGCTDEVSVFNYGNPC